MRRLARQDARGSVLAEQQVVLELGRLHVLKQATLAVGERHFEAELV